MDCRNRQLLLSCHPIKNILRSCVCLFVPREGRQSTGSLVTRQTIGKTLQFYGLHFAVNIFSVLEQLSISMQTKGNLAQTAMAGVQALKENLQQKRNDHGV